MPAVKIMSEEYLLLKWGTLKGWNVGQNETARAALQKYNNDPTSMSAMSQRDSESQQHAICELIDAIAGPITNDWTGENMTPDEAKKYVLEYRKATQ